MLPAAGALDSAVPVTNDLIGDTDVAVTEISSYQAAELSTSPRLIVVTSLHPEHLTWQSDMEKVHGRAEVIIGKQRHGPTGTVQLSFEAQFTRFGNLARDQYLPDRFE